MSTIIAVYNRPTLLQEAVASVLAQTHQAVEVLIVDDGSTDATPEVGRALEAGHPGVVRFITQPHVYYTAAWNTGLREATGEFVQFLDSDDLLLPDKFAFQVDALNEHPECGISYCYIHEHPFGEPRTGVAARHTATTFATLFPQLLSAKIWPSPSPLFRRSAVEAAGEFLDVRVQPDWEWECRLAARGVRLHHCRQFLGETRGTHALESRRKGGVPEGRSRDYVTVLERVVGHARAAAVPEAALDVLAPKLFTAARLCAREGFDDEARRALELARRLASPSRRRRLSAYSGVASVVGVSRAAGAFDRLASDARIRTLMRGVSLPRRALGYGYRQARDWWYYTQGRRILSRYSAHYARSRRAYAAPGGGAAVMNGHGFEDGVWVIRPGDRAPLTWPADFASRVDRVAASVDAMLARSELCRFVPPIATDRLPADTASIGDVKRGEIITTQLRDPLAIDGLAELCDPLLDAIERKVFGCYALVDKVYAYRSLVTRQQPRASWLWHYDNHPREMLKLMIYLTDVNDASAPFEYLCDLHGRPVVGEPLAPLYGLSRVSRDQYDRYVAAGYGPARVTGPKGTVLLFDDNIVHRATLAGASPRDVVVFQIRPAPFKVTPRLDPRWTGSFLHRNVSRDPDQIGQILKS